MSDETTVWMAIALFLIAVLALGYSGVSSTRTLPGYQLANRRLAGSVAGLSAGGSDASWWLVLLLPAAAYASGLQAAWIPIGLLLGAWFAWTYVAPRLRSYAPVAGEAITLPTFIGRRTHDRSHLLRAVAALLILVLLTVYLAAGLQIGGAFFAASFGTGDLLGLLAVAAVITVAVLFGGFRGVANLHVLLALLVAGALVLVGTRAVDELGGWDTTTQLVTSVHPGAMSLAAGGVGAGLLTALAWALGYVGQPHLLVRMMALRSPRAARAARRTVLLWMVVAFAGAVLVGLTTLAYFEQSWRPLNRPEDGVARLAELLFSPFFGAVLTTGVLAAIMGTVASQLLLCSSALVEDLYRLATRSQVPHRRHVALSRLAVLVVAASATWLAHRGLLPALDLVTLAWAGFAVAFAPIVLLTLFWRGTTSWGALAGLASGVVSILLWVRTGIDQALHELVPAFALTLLIVVLVSRLTQGAGDQVATEFAEMTDRLPRPGLLSRAGTRLAARAATTLSAAAAAAFPAPSTEAGADHEPTR
ncbi:sodium/proline symporter [Ruania albidiflava]|uniref:sodium/proline symporter n=1 Tax=Ruania albidiflava TaxID=366586 RepID=UPI0003B3638C|nr:sodium/proline symporter [Ruania albidiflava]